jgi:two-component system nitrogen regulation response regulator GlnG
MPLDGSLQTVSRLEPAFDDGAPLADTAISRTPLILRCVQDGVVIEPTKMPLAIDGMPADGAVTVPWRQLEGGVALRLGKRVLLWFERDDLHAGKATGWFGGSRLARALEVTVARLALLDSAVLIRGETGSGKELVAARLHELGPRAKRPFVAVNLATVPPSMVASALFGHVRGAFTGADADSPGLFGQADRGTLFLDELATAPLELQDALLRAVELGEVLPVGARQPRRFNVRVVSATDADLEADVAAGRFRRPLLYRIATHELLVPPLAARRADIAPLFVRFARAELTAAGLGHRIDGEHARPWLTISAVEALLARPLPGNVRELRSLAVRIASDFGEFESVPPSAFWPSATAPGTYAGTEPQPGLTPERVREVMTASQFVLAVAARELGVSNATLHDFIERTQAVRRGIDLSSVELEAALARHDGDVRQTAAAVGVSERALRLRMARDRRVSP